MRFIFYCIPLIIFIFLFKGAVKICVAAKYFKGRLIYRVFIIVFKKHIKVSGGLFKYSKKEGDYPNHIKELIFSRKITYEKIYVKTDVGFENPAITALVYGGLSGVFSMVPIFLNMFFYIHNIGLELKPNFNKEIIKISFKCIFKVKVVDIIKMLRKLK